MIHLIVLIIHIIVLIHLYYQTIIWLSFIREPKYNNYYTYYFTQFIVINTIPLQL